MSYLHGHGILHCDLKPDNILLEEFLFPKVSDSGLSKSDTSDVLMKTTAGEVKRTPAFIAPEIWMNSEYSIAGDVYAFSIVVFEMITCTRAIDDSNIYAQMVSISRGKRPTFDMPVPEVYKWLIIRCWMQNLSQLPTFIKIVVELRSN